MLSWLIKTFIYGQSKSISFITKAQTRSDNEYQELLYLRKQVKLQWLQNRWEISEKIFSNILGINGSIL
jgi:hypothetical protein